MSGDGGVQQAGLIQVPCISIPPSGGSGSDWFSTTPSVNGYSKRNWEDEERHHLLRDGDSPNPEAGRLPAIYWRSNSLKRLDECVVDQLKDTYYRGVVSVPVIVEYDDQLPQAVGQPNSMRYFLVDPRIDVGKFVSILNNTFKRKHDSEDPPQTYWSVAQFIPEDNEIEWNAVYSSTKVGDLWHGDAIFGVLYTSESKKLFPLLPFFDLNKAKPYHLIPTLLLSPFYIIVALPATVSIQLEALRLQRPTSEVGHRRSKLSWVLAVFYAIIQFSFPYLFEVITSTGVQWSVSLHLVMWIPLFIVDVIDNHLYGDPTPPRAVEEVPKISRIGCIFSLLYPLVRCVQITAAILLSDRSGWNPTFLNPILLNYDDDIAFFIAVGMAVLYYLVFFVAVIYVSRCPKTLATRRMKESCVPFVVFFTQLAFIPIIRTLILKLCSEQNGQRPHPRQVIASAAMLMFLPTASIAHTLLRDLQPELFMLHGARHCSVDKLLVFVICIVEGLTQGKDHGYWTWVILSQITIVCGICWLIVTRPFISPIAEGTHIASWGVSLWAFCVSIIARNTSDTITDQKALLLSGVVGVAMLVVLAIRLFPKTFVFPPHPDVAARFTVGTRISWVTQGSHLPRALTLPINNNGNQNTSSFSSFASTGVRTSSFTSSRQADH